MSLVGKVGIPEIAVLEVHVGVDWGKLLVVIFELVGKRGAAEDGRRLGPEGVVAAEKGGKPRAAMMEGAGGEPRDTE